MAATASPADRCSSGADAPPQTPPLKILVVDDNPSNILAIEASLADLGVALVRAGSGHDALRYLLGHDVALILLDVQMPSLDGFETARLIRQRPRLARVPIIFVTAYHQQDEDILAGYSLGAVDFLFKPIVPEILRAKASVLVDLQQRTAEVQAQGQLLRAHERREHERRLLDARRRWQAEGLRRQMDELALADRRKDEFLAMVAHELRNPLAALVTSAEVMRTAPPGSDAASRAGAAVERQLGHLGRIVDDLLDISRITSGKIDLRRTPLDLRAAITEAVHLVQDDLDARGHHLEVELTPESLPVEGDGVRLTQIVGNLLQNASRYTGSGGRISVVAQQSGQQAIVRVADNGQGIPAELRDRVFDLFVQKTPGRAGLGLGLSLVKRLVELHGGHVRADSDGENQGSTFTVSLPLAGPLVEDAQPEATEPVDPGRPLDVVVIDDSDDLRDGLCELLTALGHRVRGADNGTAGMQLLRDARADVALVDISMPGMNGYEVGERARAELREECPRLIAMTGFGQARDRQRALGAGFDQHLTKPASIEALLRAMRGQP